MKRATYTKQTDGLCFEKHQQK